MSLAPGSRLGPYDVLSALGAGGMGAVYRARDTKLNRDVAIKVLPDAFAHDPERVARFRREAQILASLNHPHIAAIYGLEEANGSLFLVLELVEGPTLAQRLRTRPLLIPEALTAARQVADALQAAHEKGIMHRDLKPANIAFTAEGQVKVLDFGLAKVLEPAASDLDDPDAPTMSVGATNPGVILGTPAYMAPEQAKGRAADKRSDVWAFGCVLYEMLTGKRAFEGEDVSDTLASVLAREPDWTSLPSDLPPAIRTVVQRCLAKDRRQRVADIAAANFVLADLTSISSIDNMSDVAFGRRRWRGMGTHAAAALAAAAIVGTAVWARTHVAPPAPRVSRLQIVPSSAAALAINGVDHDLALTPDGTRIIYTGSNGTALLVRALDQLDAVPLTGLGTPRGPFVSPDGQWIGFFDGRGGDVLKKVPIAGGPAVTLARLDGGSRGATWGVDGTIVFATQEATTGLQRISAAGGEPTVLTRPGRARGEADHLWPEFLPGNQAVLFTIRSTNGGLDQAKIAVLDLRSGTQKIVVSGGSDAHYVPSGHLVYGSAGGLLAVGFDLARLTIVGAPVPVVSQVVTFGVGFADVAVAANGTMVYLPGGGVSRSLVWVDRQGQETPIPVPPHTYMYLRLSPDGTRVAVSVGDQERDVWLLDLGRTTLTRATFDPAFDTQPVWTADGRRLIFASERAGQRNLFAQAADGTGEVERLTDSPMLQDPNSVSPDGTRLVFMQRTAATSSDVMQLPLDGTHRVTPLVRTPFAEENGAVSPDSRWLAYNADDSGQMEIYVRPFPDVNSGHWQVSIGGGTRPAWARDGRELFYLAPTGALMRVGVERGSTWSATAPTTLFDGHYIMLTGNPGQTYDVSLDGRRFLMIKESGGSDPRTSGPSSLVVVQNLGEELKRLVPTK